MAESFAVFWVTVNYQAGQLHNAHGAAELASSHSLKNFAQPFRSSALRSLGHEPDETLDIRRAIGPPLEDLMQALLQPYGDGRIGEAVAAYRQHYGESGFLGASLIRELAGPSKR